MAQPRSCACFAQETKPRRFISQVPLADDLKGYRAAQIDVEGFVSDPHRTTTQFNWFSVFARHQFIMLKALQRLSGCRLGRFLESRIAGLHSVSCCLAKQADRTEFHCPREFIAAARAGALGLRAHDPKSLLQPTEKARSNERSKTGQPLCLAYCGPVARVIAFCVSVAH